MFELRDTWGDAVNIASRLESNSLPGRIHVSRATYEHVLKDFLFELRGSIILEGGGAIETFFDW
ncbi:MAG: adenylate/guanylate cyclase domain-containing protein [Methylocystis sp.]